MDSDEKPSDLEKDVPMEITECRKSRRISARKEEKEIKQEVPVEEKPEPSTENEKVEVENNSKKGILLGNLFTDIEEEESIVTKLYNEMFVIPISNNNNPEEVHRDSRILNNECTIINNIDSNMKPSKTNKNRRNQCEANHRCDVCEKSFRTRCLLKRHHLIHTGEKPFSCNFCQKSFSLRFNLVKHINAIHTPKSESNRNCFKCSLCPKSFTSKYHMQRHTTTHTGEKPYICNECNKSFSRKYHLERHIYGVHSGQKPYSCNICRKSFSMRRYLNNHTRVHTGKKQYSCKLCKKKFNDLYYLKEHSRLHTDERPYTCDLCQRTFTQKCTLRYHIKAHMDSKLNKCKICKKSYKRLSTYKAHVKTHKKGVIKPFTCNLCEKKFTTLRSVKQHCEIHEKEKKIVTKKKKLKKISKKQ